MRAAHVVRRIAVNAALCLLGATAVLWCPAGQGREPSGAVVEAASAAQADTRAALAAASQGDAVWPSRSHGVNDARRGSPAASASATEMQDLRARLDQKLAELRAAQAQPKVAPNQTARHQATTHQVAKHQAAVPNARHAGDTNSPQAIALARAYRASVLGTPIAMPKAAPAQGAHWAYSGPNGPQAWGAMESDFATCSSGQRQSPIDIHDGIRVDLEPIKFDYHPTAFRVIDNGHTIQVNLDPGNSISVMGRRFDLVQFHFHRPSEERVNGRQFAMVAHLVHKDKDGKLAVVSVLIDAGKANPVVQQVWNNLPLEKHEEQRGNALMDVAALLPDVRTYYTYMGSLTTPPCSEGVLWMVLKQPTELSPDQIGIFARLYPMNARPVQPGSGRLIKESD